eukprot:552741_1
MAPLTPKPQESGMEKIYTEKAESEKWTTIPACALNTLNMFGTGPFITIPFLFAATSPPGPQAMIGYALAALCCICDSFIWGELGAMYPQKYDFVFVVNCMKLLLNHIA